MEPIRYYSTGGRAPLVSFKEALFQGQPPDGGLYMPTRIPGLSLEKLWSLKGKPYSQVAFYVLEPFLEAEIPEEALWRITEEAYDFPVPLERVLGRRYVLRLDQGPTASFKDFAARFLARVMRHFSVAEDKDRLILVATSGDTGSAVANAFHGLQGLRVVVLYPMEEVSPRQAKQISTLGGNVLAVAAKAKFDRLQTMAMRAFEDPDLAGLRLTSANSINWGRLLPQVGYHVYGFLSAADSPSDLPVDSVASGNFGNVTADFLAVRMGKPAERIIVATNENDEFPAFLETGIYRPILPSKACLSNAMNVGNPSNLRRLLDLYGGTIRRDGTILKMPDMAALRRDAAAISVSDHLTRLTIQEAYEKHGLVLEPHGAVAWAALKRYLWGRDENVLAVATETAHPAKFPEVLGELGIKVEIPPSLSGLDERPSHEVRIGDSYEELKELLLSLR
ncbi:MAG: threonine synthase [Thermodesulfobacteriota bacterium]